MEGVKYLLDPRQNDAVVAELYPGQSVRIFDPRVLNRLETTGIVIDPKRRKQFGRGGYIYPSDPRQDLFAIAFEEFYVPHGMIQGGCFWWHEKTYTRLSERELAKKLVELYMATQGSSK